jgi:hypothetical protein
MMAAVPKQTVPDPEPAPEHDPEPAKEPAAEHVPSGTYVVDEPVHFDGYDVSTGERFEMDVSAGSHVPKSEREELAFASLAMTGHATREE